jgi:RNA polymerase sigma factor FliA
MHTPRLWEAAAGGDPDARARLASEHLGLVHHIARRMSRTLAVRADFDELVSAGVVGLLGALDAFEPARGLAFSTYATPRIRGAILDELRRHDYASRSVRRKARELAQAREALSRALGRAAEDRDVARHLGVDVETVWRWQADVERSAHVALDRSAPDSPDRGGRANRAGQPRDVPACDERDAVDERLNDQQEAAILRAAILRLTSQERTVISLYYLEDLKLREIADVLVLTQSRVSQIRTKALGKLRAELRRLRECVA